MTEMAGCTELKLVLKFEPLADVLTSLNAVVKKNLSYDYNVKIAEHLVNFIDSFSLVSV